MGAPTSVKEIFETLENGVGFQSLLRFLVPTLFGDLPHSSGNSRSFEAAWLWRSLPLRNHDGDIVVRVFWKRHPPCRKLEGQMVSAWIYCTSTKYIPPR